LTKGNLNYEIEVNALSPDGTAEGPVPTRNRHFKEANLKLADLWKDDANNPIKQVLSAEMIKAVNKGKTISPTIYLASRRR